MLSTLQKQKLEQPPPGTPSNIIGVRRGNGKLYRVCICGRSIGDRRLIKQQDHDCSKLKKLSLQQNIDIQIAQRLRQKLPSSNKNINDIRQMIQQIKSSCSEMIKKNLFDILIYQFKQQDLTPQVQLKIKSHIFNTMCQCLVNLHKSILEGQTDMEEILKKQKYPVPIQKIIKSPKDLWDKDLILERIQELNLAQITKDTYKKQINHLAKQFNAPTRLNLSIDKKKIIQIQQIIQFNQFEDVIRSLILNCFPQIGLDLYLVFLSGCKRNELKQVQKQTIQVLENQEKYFSNAQKRKMQKFGFIYYTNQFLALARAYNWSGFHPNFEKLIKNMRSVFGFPFYTLRKLHFCCLNALCNKQFNAQIAKFSVESFSAQSYSISKDQQLHNIRLQNRKKFEIENLQFFTDFERKHQEYAHVNNFPLRISLNNAYLQNLRQYCTDGDLNQELGIITYYQDYRQELKNNQEKIKKIKTKKIKKQREFKNKKNKSKPKQIIQQNESRTNNREFFDILGQQQDQYFNDTFMNILQISKIEMACQKNEKETVQKLKSRNSQKKQIIKKQIKDKQIKNKYTLKSQSINEQKSQSINEQKSQNMNEQKQKIFQQENSVSQIINELYQNQKSIKQIKDQKIQIKLLSLEKTYNQNKKEEYHIKNLVKSLNPDIQLDFEYPVINFTQNKQFQLSSYKEQLLSRNQKENKKCQNQAILENKSIIDQEKQQKPEFGELEPFEAQTCHIKTLELYRILKRPFTEIHKKVFKSSYDADELQYLLKECPKCKKQIGQVNTTNSMICEICTIVIHKKCLPKLKGSQTKIMCMYCADDFSNVLPSKKSLKILPLATQNLLMKSDLELKIPSNFLKKSQNTKESQSKIKKIFQDRGKKLVKANQLYFDGIDYNPNYDPYIMISSSCTEHAVKIYNGQDYFPPVYVKLVGENNYSLFALENIPKNTLICEYAGMILVHTFGNMSRFCNMTYLWRNKNRPELIVSAAIEASVGTIINHKQSNLANMKVKRQFCNGQVKLLMYTSEDVKKDQQLCYNYCERKLSTYDVIGFGFDLKGK